MRKKERPLLLPTGAMHAPPKDTHPLQHHCKTIHSFLRSYLSLCVTPSPLPGPCVQGTSLITRHTHLGPCRKSIPRALGGS